MSKLKIAVIGTGLVGTFHAEAFFRNPNSELVAVCDVDKEKVNSVAQSFNCKAYEDFTKLINTETLDAISIATPEQIRIEPAVMSVKKGLKILLEKPLGRNLEKIHELVDKIKDHNKIISVNFILHEDPRYKLMKEKVKNDEIGNIVSCFARRRGNRFGIEIYAPWTDLLSSTLIHDIQMTMSINKSKPVRVFAEAVIRECKEYDSHDAVMAIMKFDDGSLAFRRSCAHGVCGSDAMVVNGENMLACQVLVKEVSTPIKIEPIRGLPVIKDLVVNMDSFFDSYKKVMPYLVNDDEPGERERLQSPEDRDRFEDTTKCILCAACTTSCPVFWTADTYVGPAAIVNAHRFVFDSRDNASKQRLEILKDVDGAFRCRTAFNCTSACPRGIQVTKAIEDVKRETLTIN